MTRFGYLFLFFLWTLAKATTDQAFFVLCTADGSLFSLRAWTGDGLQTLLTGPPLVTQSKDSMEDLFPGLDGRLYKKGTNEVIPVSIPSLLEHPVRSCPDEDDELTDCGLLTATVHTNVIALTPQGQLQWSTLQSSPALMTQKHQPTLLLQRNNYHVQYTAVSNGQVLWNATLGTYQALEFSHEDGFLETSSIDAPSIVFTNNGRTLVAVDPISYQLIWRVDAPSTLASVFLMDEGDWKPVEVLTEQQVLKHTHATLPRQLSLPSMSGMEEPVRPTTHHLLELPAPPNGIVLSWPVVTALLVGLATVLVYARVWYMRQKASWLQKVITESTVKDESTPPVPAPPAPHPPAPQETSVLPWNDIPLIRYSRYASEFKEGRPLGKGGFGTVFWCQNVLDDRAYAVKKVTIRGHTADDRFRRQLERVLREVKILAVLDHPNIVRYYNAWLELENSAETPAAEKAIPRCYSSSMLTESKWNDEESASSWAAWKKPNHMSGLLRNPMVADGITEEPSFRGLDRRMDDASDLFFFDETTRDGDDPTNTRSATRGVHFEPSATTEVNPPSPVKDETKHASLSGVPSETGIDEATATEPSTTPDQVFRHTLYIQMQLCSSQTVSEFLSDAESRRGPPETLNVDIPAALRLFLQVAQAVQYVHQRGLIHRDLKPSNCFIDESGNVKVGDFGLSREANERDEVVDELHETPPRPMRLDDHTAGVGTRSYASPEQLEGSDYDASTDVFALGIILFELCYPMYTGMERGICLTNLRKRKFPTDWEESIGQVFPTLQDWIESMTATNPKTRPSAEAVVQYIEKTLSDFSILSFEPCTPDTLLIRIETTRTDDALSRVKKCLEEAADPVEIVQYGLRSVSDQSVVEFAIHTPVAGAVIIQRLREFPDIAAARMVGRRHTSVG